jgi:hypothetical protein
VKLINAKQILFGAHVASQVAQPSVQVTPRCQPQAGQTAMCVQGLNIMDPETQISDRRSSSSERGLVHVHEGLVVGVERSILDDAHNEVVASQVI